MKECYLLDVLVRDYGNGTVDRSLYNSRCLCVIPVSDTYPLSSVPAKCIDLIRGIGYDCGWLLNEYAIHQAIEVGITEGRAVSVLTPALADRRQVQVHVTVTRLLETMTLVKVPEQEKKILIDTDEHKYPGHLHIPFLECTNDYYDSKLD